MSEQQDDDKNDSPASIDQVDGQPLDEQPIEGVRLVGRDEAEAALESGAAISRHSQGRLVSLVGYESDEPDPTWADTVDRSAPAVRVLGDNTERVSAALRIPESLRGTARSAAPTVLDDDFDILDLRASDRDDDKPAEPTSAARDENEPVVSQPSTNPLPHWTEPPTGEVPSLLGDLGGVPMGGASSSGGDSDDDHDWSLEGLGDASKLGVPGDSADAELDAKFAALGEVPAIDADDASAAVETDAEHKPESADNPDTQAAPDDRHNAIDTIEEKVESLKRASIVTRSATGAVAVALAIAAFSAGPMWAMLLTLVVLTLAAVEYFDALRRVGYRPATALGLIAVVGAVAGTYARGEAAIPLVFALVTAFTFLWYLTGIIKDSPTANVAVTLLGVMWIGVFGSYSALLLREPDHRGIAFLGAAIILVVVYDTFAYLGGVMFGRHALAPDISPSKTWEGLFTATAATVLIGGVFIHYINPWGVWQGFALGIVVACVAPIGDLVESMVKRDLGLKDMGRLLPGHGGVLDRFDALLFVLPATYYLVRLLNLA